MSHHSVTYSSDAGGRGKLPEATAFIGGGHDATFNALADPTRRAVLDLLRTGSRPAGEIARAFSVSRPAISKHLGILRRAHLVEERKQGRHRFYQINPEPLKAVDAWLEQYRQFWTANLENLKSFVEAEFQKELDQNKSTGQQKSDHASERKIQSRRKKP